MFFAKFYSNSRKGKKIAGVHSQHFQVAVSLLLEELENK